MPGLGLGLRIQQRPMRIRPGGLRKACVVGGLEGWCARKPAGGPRKSRVARAQVLGVLGSASSLDLAWDSRLGGHSSPCQGQLSTRIRLASARLPDSVADSEDPGLAVFFCERE